MQDLDFSVDRSKSIEYVAEQIQLADSGDARAMSFIEFLWDEDPELLQESYKYNEDQGYSELSSLDFID